MKSLDTKSLNKTTISIQDKLSPIKLEYSDNSTFFGDTIVTIYDDYKLSLVLTDDCGAVIDHKIIFPKRGDIIIFRPDEVHFGRFPKSCEYKFISFLIPIDFFENLFTSSHDILSPFLDTSADKINLFRFNESVRKKVIGIAEEIMEMIQAEPESHRFDIVIFSKLIEVLNICNKYYDAQKKLQNTPTVPTIVTEVFQKIDEAFPDFIGLSVLARHCGCSVTYLTQTFRHYTGKSIHNYLMERRLEYARKLLQNGASVTDACYLSGFSDSSGFILQFKKHFHITPGKYKKGAATE